MTTLNRQSDIRAAAAFTVSLRDRVQRRGNATGTPFGAIALVAAMACAGFALTMAVFFPGYLTRDAGHNERTDHRQRRLV
jgi:hypothetical protein